MSALPSSLQSTASSPERYRIQVPASQELGYDDEIDLLALFKAVAATWKVWLLAAVAVTVVLMAYLFPTILAGQAAAPYSKIITFTFKGVEKSEYPSGAPFRIQDIIAPGVLQAVLLENSFAESGLTLADLQKALTIEPYTPFYREINSKYQLLLGAKNLDYDQIQQIQERKRAELNMALNTSAVIAFNPKATSATQGVISAVLTAIPLEWARQAINDKGVLKADIQLNSSQTLDYDLFKNVDYVVLSDLFADKIQGLRDNITKVAALDGAATVKDPQTGWSLSDLSNNLEDLEKYTIDELMSPIRSLGLSRNPKLAAFYYEEKRAMLGEELAKLQDESALIKTAFENYNTGEQSLPAQASNTQTANVGYPGFVPQMSGDLIEKLIQAGGEDSVEKYRQALNDKWLDSNLKLAEVNAEIRRVERLIKAVKGGGQDSLTATLRDEYFQRAEATMPVILDKLKNYYDINWRIYEQLSRERVGSVGYLYKDGHQGVLRGSSGFNAKRTLLIYMGLLFVMTLLVVPAVMIRNALKARAVRDREVAAAA